jgi:hypothetical protein
MYTKPSHSGANIATPVCRNQMSPGRREDLQVWSSPLLVHSFYMQHRVIWHASGAAIDNMSVVWRNHLEPRAFLHQRVDRGLGAFATAPADLHTPRAWCPDKKGHLWVTQTLRVHTSIVFGSRVCF